jgi:glycosyltransferase involved in cell wall biosynthesis
MCTLAGGLTAAGAQVEMIVADAAGADRSQLPDSVELVDLRSSRTVAAIPRLAFYLRRETPSALVSAKDHANVAAIAAGLVARHTRIVATVHAQPSAALAEPESWTGHVVRRAIRFAYPRADAIVAVSEGVADDVARVAPRTKGILRVIRNPVISTAFWQAAGEPPQHPWLRARHDCPVLVWCGRLTPEKDPILAVNAFAMLRHLEPAVLLFVGDGPLSSAVAARARELGIDADVAVTGLVPNAPSYIRAADALVLSSRREGLPSVLIEALALGTPVVATNCESGPEEILDHGRLGRLVPVADVDSLAAGMADALAATRGIAAPEDLAPYTEESAVRHYVTLINDLGIELQTR